MFKCLGGLKEVKSDFLLTFRKEKHSSKRTDLIHMLTYIATVRKSENCGEDLVHSSDFYCST